MRSQNATLEMVVETRNDIARQTASQQRAPVSAVAELATARPKGKEARPIAASETAPAGFLNRLAYGVRGYLHRRTEGDQFRWNVPPQHLGVIHPQTVYCVELPTSDPIGMLTSYVQQGVKADHVVFVGDPLTMTDDAYYRATQQGALVHETKKRSQRRLTEEELTLYHVAARPAVTPTKNPNAYTYKPRAAVVTKEQLQAHIDAIAAHKR
jgi:hypothetical protein